MMEVSLVLSVSRLHNEQNHLFSNSKISSFKSLERQELKFGRNGIVSMPYVSFLAEKQRYWLQETLILMVFEINLLATTAILFSSSVTNCSTPVVSRWELKLNGAWGNSEILWVRAHKKFDGSTDLLDLNFIFMFRVVDYRTGEKDHGTLFQSDGKIFIACRIGFVD